MGPRLDVPPQSSPPFHILLLQLDPAPHRSLTTAFFVHTFLISVHFVHLDLSSLSLCVRVTENGELCTFYCCQSLGAALTKQTFVLNYICFYSSFILYFTNSFKLTSE